MRTRLFSPRRQENTEKFEGLIFLRNLSVSVVNIAKQRARLCKICGNRVKFAAPQPQTAL